MVELALCRSPFQGAASFLRPSRLSTCLALSIILVLADSADAAYGSGGKKKFMAAYPVLFKFFLFWWCVFVFAVMGVYIIDQLMYRKWGGAKVQWSVEHVFQGGVKGGRETFWKQFADPSTWSANHPLLRSADIKMATCGEEGAAAIAAAKEAIAKDPELDDGVLDTKLKYLDSLKPLAEGLGVIMRHKENVGPNPGGFFCTRECIRLDKPKEGPWEMAFQTLEAGPGYPYTAGDETTVIEMHPAAEDGSVRCVMTGSSTVTSRIFRWWSALAPTAKAGAIGMLQAVEEEVLASKKE